MSSVVLIRTKSLRASASATEPRKMLWLQGNCLFYFYFLRLPTSIIYHFGPLRNQNYCSGEKQICNFFLHSLGHISPHCCQPAESFSLTIVDNCHILIILCPVAKSFTTSPDYFLTHWWTRAERKISINLFSLSLFFFFFPISYRFDPIICVIQK